ncbi:sugar ABC transporter substrate-binding protein [Asticcacaulis sp.]|uniref:sugar ABC transporter substrate-binding protein n=1 Tax=Asticcacaulis sp. TaxID=1872648 RepID=UPI003F7B5F3A
MNTDRRRFGLALAGVALSGAAVSLTACAKKHEPLRIWAMGLEGEALGTIAGNFEAQNPAGPVRVQALPWGAAHEKLLTAFAADNLPDVIALGNTWVSEFAALGALEPLTDRLSRSGIIPDRWFDGPRKSVTLDGQVLGVPWYVDTRLLFYRTDLLQKAGFDTPSHTWAGWDVQLAALSGAHRGGKYGLLMPFAEYEPLVAFCLQADAPILIDSDTRGGFRQPGIRDSFAYAASLYQRGYAARLTHSEVTDVYSSFARGDFAFIITGPWNLAEFAKRLPAELQDQWATAPLPGPHGPGDSSAGGVSLCIPRASRRKDDAFRFIEYLCDPQRQADFYQTTSDLPADRSAWLRTSLMHDRRSLTFFDQLNRTRPPPQVPEWERIANEMVAALERVVRGITTLDAALKGLDEFAWTLLAKRRAMLELKGVA